MKLILEHSTIVPPAETDWTEQQFYDFCSANTDWTIERNSKGDILLMPLSALTDSNLELRAGGALDAWNNKLGLGYIFSSQAGFTLPNGAVRSPDAAWITKARIDALPDSELESFAHICPDFVIEIRSKTDKLKPLQEKMQEYMDNGCRLGFMINPYEGQAWIYRPQLDAALITDFSLSLNGVPVLPGFELPLSIFKV